MSMYTKKNPENRAKSRDKRAENTPGCHHAPSCQHFLDIRLHFTSVRTILKQCFPYKLNIFSIHWKARYMKANFICFTLKSFAAISLKVLLK